MSREHLYPSATANSVTITKEGVLTRVSNEFIKSVQSYTIPNTVKKIGKNAFARCGNLKSITFSEGLQYIDEKAFYLCKSLITVNLPKSLVLIGDYAFALCVKLQTVKIGKNVKEIGLNAFAMCSSLQSFNVSTKNENFVNDAYGCLIDNVKKTLLQYPIKREPVDTSYTIPKNITTIGSNAFRSCKTLKLVNLENVTIIQDNAFAYCTNLVKVNKFDKVIKIGDSSFYKCMFLEGMVNIALVKSIGDQAFYDCAKINSDGPLVVPATMNKIGKSAFFNCRSINRVLIYGGEIGDNAFACDSKISFNKQKHGKTLQRVLIGTHVSLGNRVFEKQTKLVSIFFYSIPTQAGSVDQININNLTSAFDNPSYKRLLKIYGPSPIINDLIFNHVFKSSSAEYENQQIKNIRFYVAY
uniref:Surface antigen BspA-like n=1 Tax=viral metagenome TaxID=1070528 RepID=A0A6C0K0J7_9ZZZZ